MRRPTVRGALLCALGALAIACGSSSNPTTPTPVTTTDTFTGSVNQNGAKTHQFSTVAAGQVVATLKTVGPDATKPIGFAIGTFSTDATGNGICQLVDAADIAIQGAVLTASASTAGKYCVRIYDTGSVTAATPFTYTITVVHP
jgi:hypothetical protein